MERVLLLFIMAVLCSVLAKPLGIETEIALATSANEEHKLSKRFINPVFNLDSVPDTNFPQLRARRSADEKCEKLRLCKLHAKSSYNFLAAYELYFVNKENARLWDHHARSLADCERRYGDCYRR